MNEIAIVPGCNVLAGGTSPDLPLQHSHRPGLPAKAIRPLIPVKPVNVFWPVSNEECLVPHQASHHFTWVPKQHIGISILTENRRRVVVPANSTELSGLDHANI